VTLGKLTYDGTTLTNGFHPRWFAVIVLLRVLCGSFGAEFYVALTFVSLSSMVATFELGRRFARELGGSSLLSSAVPAICSVGTGRLLTSGMESVIAVPLFMWLLIELARATTVTPRLAAKLGLIASLATLARLDIAVFAALVIVGFVVFVRPSLAEFARLLLPFCLGGVLLPLYLTTNYMFFGSLLPMSALAKQLHTSLGFNLTYAQRVAFGTVYGPMVAAILPLGIAALFLLVTRDRARTPPSYFAGGLALIFAFVFFGLNARTGWTFFGWYAYPIASAAIAALVFICQHSSRFAPWLHVQTLAVFVSIAVVPTVALRYYVDHGPRWTVADNPLLAMSYDLAERMNSQHGLFAMGAIAGVATYVLDKPVLQLEGIVSDGRLIEHIKRESALELVLREYRVDYLIVSLASDRAERQDGCYVVTEPNAVWAGTRTPKMRGTICTEPFVHFLTKKGPNPWSRFSTLQTLVWNLRDVRWER
jgi:hypothetical protein